MTNYKFLSAVIVFLGLTVQLSAQPESLDTFFDFENVTGEGPEFIIGESPFTVRIIGFTLQDVDPGLAHSGNRALVLDPSAPDHKILFERGVYELQFYAVDTLGGGRIEIRERHFRDLNQQGVVNGLTTSPGLQSFVSFSGDVLDLSDLNWTNGMKELKIINPAGQIAIDDLGFTYVEGPPDNTIFEDFWFFLERAEFLFPTGSRTDFIIGFPPYTAHFTGGVITGGLPAYNHSLPGGGGHWAIVQQEISGQPVQEITGVIEFETPVAQLQFYAAIFFEDDGFIEIFDTEGNLLTATDDIGMNVSVELTQAFTYFDFNAVELGAPGGIGSLHYTNRTITSTTGNVDSIGIDDIGYTPIGAPGSGSEGPPPCLGSLHHHPTVGPGSAVRHGGGFIRCSQRR